MIFGEYELVNESKVERAIYGVLSRGGIRVGGVGETASDALKIAEYDRLGGLVRLNSDIVKKGSFYDFKARAPRAEPQVLLMFNINGKQVEVPADAPLPPLVRAAKEAEQGGASTDDGLGTMTLAELKDYAADKNIDLGSAKTKAAVLAAIRGESEESSA